MKFKTYTFKETKDKINEFEKDRVTVLDQWSSDLKYCGVCGAESPSKRIIEIKFGSGFFEIVLRQEEYYCCSCGCREYIKSISNEEWEEMKNKKVPLMDLIKGFEKLVKSKEG